eukprot:13543968-Alexandrium_andersonii.AAC.1
MAARCQCCEHLSWLKEQENECERDNRLEPDSGSVGEGYHSVRQASMSSRTSAANLTMSVNAGCRVLYRCRVLH